MSDLTRRQVLAGAAGVAATAALAACGDDDESPTGEDLSGVRAGAMSDFKVGDQFKATEPVSFTMLYNNHPNYPIKKDWLFWAELQKRTNATFTTTDVPLSDYNNKRSLMIGAGDAPLIMGKTYPSQEDPFVSSGTILAVSDYLDLMPHFKDRIEKWNLKADVDTRRQEDGKFYLLPGVHEKLWTDYSLAIRTDILSKLSLEAPKTWDDLYTVLKAMKTAYPDTYPLSDRFSKSPASEPAGALFSVIGEAYKVWAGWNYQAGVSWDYDAKKYFFTGASDQYRQVLEYLNKLVKEGLMDPESFTQDDDQARQKLAQGKSFVLSANAQAIVNDYRKDLANIPGATIAKIPRPIGPLGEQRLGTGRLENGVMLSRKARDSKNFVAMMQLLDWVHYSDAGQEFARWGVEGVTYTKDASGKRTLAPDVDVLGLNPSGTKHLQKDFGFYNGIFAYGGTTELVGSFFSEEEKQFQETTNAREMLEVPPPYPFTDVEREQVTLIQTPLKDYVMQQSLRFALGQRPLTEWSAYLSELKGKQMDQYMDQVTRAYERYKSNHG
jgi:putative aldouronate transport system substrate-binding protein